MINQCITQLHRDFWNTPVIRVAFFVTEEGTFAACCHGIWLNTDEVERLLGEGVTRFDREGDQPCTCDICISCILYRAADDFVSCKRQYREYEFIYQ